MTLQLSDGKLFFQLMWKLQYYVNLKKGFHKGVSTFEQYAELKTKAKLKARDEIWNNPDHIRAYVRENPDRLPPEELRIVENWTRFVKGKFMILRHLKKGSIFIKDDTVYSVHGILEPLEDVLPSYALPRMVEVILLPFKGQIIYDGLLMGYNVHFGSGIRSDLNETYNIAKQKERIVYTLEPETEAPKSRKPAKDITPQLNEAREILAKTKGSSIQNAALALAHTGIEIAEKDARDQLDPNTADALARQLSRQARKLLKSLDILAED
jgi:hypothetical protein